MNLAKNWPLLHSVARRVQGGFFENDGIRLHYVTLGEGPLVVLIHGFPEFWYSWRHQIEALSADYQVVAIDQRGFNESGRPASTDGYRVERLVEDVAALMQHLGRKQAVIVGADVEIGAVAVMHKNRLIQIGGEQVNQFVELNPSAETQKPKLAALVDALNTLKVPAEDVIDIIKMLKHKRALYGELIIE